MNRYENKKSAGRWIADTVVAMLATGSLFAGYMVAVAGVTDGRLDESLSSVYYEVAEVVSPSDNKVISPPTQGVYANGVGSKAKDNLVACDKSDSKKVVSHLATGFDACPHETTQPTSI